MMDIILDYAKLAKFKKQKELVGNPQIILGVGQKVFLQESVIYNWRIEEGLEGICMLTFDFKPAIKWHNMSGNFSSYQIQRNAYGTAILVRVAG